MTGQILTNSLVSFPTFNGYAPEKGPRALTVDLDFSVQATYNLNLAAIQQEDRVEFIQGIYINNKANTNPLIITCGISQQSLTIAAGWQGYLPLLCPNTPSLTFASTTASVIVTVHLLTFPVAPVMWDTDGNAVTATISGNVSTIAAGGTGTDASANKPSILANLLATVNVNLSRSIVFVQNQAANTVQVVLDGGAGGNTSVILLAPGGGANTQGASWQSEQFKARVRVYGSNALDQVCVREI